MRRLEHLIKITRRETENERTNVTDGISDDDFVRYFKEGNERIREKIINSHANIFLQETFQKILR